MAPLLCALPRAPTWPAYLASRRSSPTVCSLPSITPARTCADAAAQARAALRRFRDAHREGSAASSSVVGGGGDAPPPADGSQTTRLAVWLPLPSPGRPREDDGIYNYDQSDWPGGIQQRFRRLRPLVEAMLEGYDPQFVGMLESPADGIGVWRASGGAMTVVCQVGNQNFAPFARLCAGEFGDAVLRPGHTLLAVNPAWTASKDIGQLWDRKLKAAAAALIDDPSAWLPLYHLDDLRTAQGATGLLFRAWPHGWQLYHTSEHQEAPTAALDDPPILVSEERPSREQQIEALNAALRAAKQQQKGGKR